MTIKSLTKPSEKPLGGTKEGYLDTLTITESICIPDGTAAAPSLHFCDWTSTGMYSNGGELNFATSGVEHLALVPGNSTESAYRFLAPASDIAATFTFSAAPGAAGMGYIGSSGTTFISAASGNNLEVTPTEIVCGSPLRVNSSSATAFLVETGGTGDDIFTIDSDGADNSFNATLSGSGNATTYMNIISAGLQRQSAGLFFETPTNARGAGLTVRHTSDALRRLYVGSAYNSGANAERLIFKSTVLGAGGGDWADFTDPALVEASTRFNMKYSDGRCLFGDGGTTPAARVHIRDDTGLIVQNSSGGSLFSVNNTSGVVSDTKVTIDATDPEAFLVRKDADGGDAFLIDTDGELALFTFPVTIKEDGGLLVEQTNGTDIFVANSSLTNIRTPLTVTTTETITVSSDNALDVKTGGNVSVFIVDTNASEVEVASGAVLKLPTTGGTATGLDYYEEYAIPATEVRNSTNTASFFSVAQNISGKIVRVGDAVNLILISAIGTGSAATPAALFGIIPARFRPSVSLYTGLSVADNGTNKLGLLNVRNNGDVVYYPDGTLGNFAGAGSTILRGVTESWTVS